VIGGAVGTGTVGTGAVPVAGTSDRARLPVILGASFLGFGIAMAAMGAAASGTTAGGEAVLATATAVTPPPVTLEQIMAEPSWIGFPVQDAVWSVDARAVYYHLKRAATTLTDLHRIDLASGRDELIAGAATATVEAGAVYDRRGTHAAFLRNEDLFASTAGGLGLTQITRGMTDVRAPQFSADGRLLEFRSGNDWFIHDFASGLTSMAAVLRAEKSPDAAPAPDALRDMQLRTFTTLKKLKDQKDFARRYDEEQRRLDPTRAAMPYYLGEDVKIRDTALSPNGRWLLVVTEPKTYDKGREGKLTRYVTNSGYEEFEDERLRVGRNPPAPQSLLLIDLSAHAVHPLDIGVLPGIHDDPLQAVREENGNSAASTPAPASPSTSTSTSTSTSAPTSTSTQTAPPAPSPSSPVTRKVSVISDDSEEAASASVAWSRDGAALAIELFAADHKDRWLASVDFADFSLVTQDRLSDAAWVNGEYSDFGWLLDGRTLWYQSEESGFAQLYTKTIGAPARALTQGAFELTDPVPSADGRWLYALGNAAAPYSYDVYRVPSRGGKLERVTHLEGVESFALSQDGKQLLLTHSSSYVPAQIAIARADGSGSVRELTDTRSAAFKALAWVTPEIVQVPSTHFNGSIFAKLYRPTADGAQHPAVVFVHGAGYLQDVHLRYPYYFREQMFNNLLVRRGYVVIDLDYRASRGYGRDWRTAIYRQMGHPELEDLLDGKKWLLEHASADAGRFGVYGGSYGGFMTLMALFRAPGEFAAGAALRPVTDWMQYDDTYTSEILNDPQVDPIAYARSSPIEFAAGLRDSLLICHGVIDDNVLFEDSMRLYERLIELHKDNFTISPYPLDRHGFTNADSWLDEYKRIDRLFKIALEGTSR
jgi:dipeptidyl aminopeptidase/acylaminoacyl peptidase